MNQKNRIIIALVIILILAAVIFALEAWRGRSNSPALDVLLESGDVPVYLDGSIIAGFTSADLEGIQQVSFIDDEEGKTQDGWLLRDILAQYVKTDQFHDDVSVIITSTSRDKEVALTWGEVKNEANMVMFDLSGRGTLKLVSKLPQLDIRDEWVQDVDKIEIITP